jgi:hypothetical protein
MLVESWKVVVVWWMRKVGRLRALYHYFSDVSACVRTYIDTLITHLRSTSVLANFEGYVCSKRQSSILSALVNTQHCVMPLSISSHLRKRSVNDVRGMLHSTNARRTYSSISPCLSHPSVKPQHFTAPKSNIAYTSPHSSLNILYAPKPPNLINTFPSTPTKPIS